MNNTDTSDEVRDPDAGSQTFTRLKEQLDAQAMKAFTAIETDDLSFVEIASNAGLYEVRSGEIAMRRSGRDDIRRFAHKMVEDYAALAGRFGSLLGGLSERRPAAALNEIQEAMIEDLQYVSQELFDERYLAQLEAAQDNTVALFAHYRDHGKNQALIDLVSRETDLLEKHREMLRELKES